jgi:hypothetical protein
MAVVERLYLADTAEPSPPRAPAIAALEFIKNHPLPELETSSQSDEVFYNYQFGRVFASIIDVHGQVTINSAGYKQLHGTDGKERFIATLHPEREFGDQLQPGSVHVVIFPKAPMEQQNYMTPITIPLDSGRPLVTHNVKERPHASATIGDVLSPSESYSEIQHLAALMSESFIQDEMNGLAS